MACSHAGEPVTVDEPPNSGAWLEIDAGAIAHNIHALRAAFEPAKLCMVIKGNAYGHGYGSVIPVAEAAGQRDFAVFSAREAHHALNASDGKSTFQVMGSGDARNLPWLIKNKCQVWLNTISDVACAREAAQQHGRLAVHVEIDSGMHRSGIDPVNAFDAAVEAHDHPDLELVGVATHLAGAEDPDNMPRIREQMSVYHGFLDQLKDAGISPGLRHMASTSAGLLHEECRLDMVRSGISCYGFWPSRHVRNVVEPRRDAPDLKPVMSWKTRVMAMRDVKDGEYIGYGRRYEAEGDTRIALLPVGYGDGLSRDITNNGYVLIRGRRATIVGAVNMNMVQVHVGHIPDIQIGDEAVIIGRQGDRAISVAGFTDYNNIINYELMARLSWELPRIVVNDEATEEDQVALAAMSPRSTD